MSNKRSSAELKGIARERLLGNYGSCILIFFLYVLIELGGGCLPLLFSYGSYNNTIVTWIISIVISLLISVFSIGLVFFFLNLARGKEASISNIIWAFSHHPDKTILVSLYITVLTQLCSLPLDILPYFKDRIGSSSNYLMVETLFSFVFLVGVIIVDLNYALAYYVLVDYPEYSVIDVLRNARHMMKGNKGRYFYIILTFIGWMLLCTFLTCGIGFLWLVPYIKMTDTVFYLDVIGELDQPQEDIPPQYDQLYY